MEVCAAFRECLPCLLESANSNTPDSLMSKTRAALGQPPCSPCPGRRAGHSAGRSRQEEGAARSRRQRCVQRFLRPRQRRLAEGQHRLRVPARWASCANAPNSSSAICCRRRCSRRRATCRNCWATSGPVAWTRPRWKPTAPSRSHRCWIASTRSRRPRKVAPAIAALHQVGIPVAFNFQSRRGSARARSPHRLLHAGRPGPAGSGLLHPQ